MTMTLRPRILPVDVDVDDVGGATSDFQRGGAASIREGSCNSSIPPVLPIHLHLFDVTKTPRRRRIQCRRWRSRSYGRSSREDVAREFWWRMVGPMMRNVVCWAKVVAWRMGCSAVLVRRDCSPSTTKSIWNCFSSSFLLLLDVCSFFTTHGF